MKNTFIQLSKAVLQPLKTAWLSESKVDAFLLRLDLIHPDVSGNKWFKLKNNLKTALERGNDTILTFGGARSNHIAATATACKGLGLKSIGFIRGHVPDNPTLSHARAEGMQLFFMDREAYREKENPVFLKELHSEFHNTFIIPEGGNNELGIKGAGEILDIHDTGVYSHICCPVGTGCTLAGLASKAEKCQKVLGFSALKKAEDQRSSVRAYLKAFPNHAGWDIITDYHFGGFAKKTKALSDFMKTFYQGTGIPLDVVYTGKMMFGIKDMALKGRLEAGSRILIIHTGGLQGNKK